MIELPADPDSDLVWDNISEREGSYRLNFGWENLDPYNPAKLQASRFAVEEFSKQFPEAKKAVLAVCNKPFSTLFHFSEALEENAKQSNRDFEIFCAELFSDMLHHLASALPDETIPVLQIELPLEAPLERWALYLCKRRFEHIEVECIGRRVPIQGTASIAVCLPQDEVYDVALFQEIFKGLEGCNYICVPEEFLNEHWDGVDYLIVDKSHLSDIGQRMIIGFEAAGGEVFEWEAFKKRGAAP